jgi:ABC-2 type transport system permease protein
VFLFPLRILALSYNLLSAEREQGTLALVLSQPVRLSTVVLGKLVARFGLVVVLGAALTVRSSVPLG